MKITRELRKEINAAVRKNVRGANPGSRIGMRGDDRGPNALRWTTDDDLWDAWPQAMVKELDDDPDHPGCYALDLYVDTGNGYSRELETNVYVLIRDGHVVGATADSFKVTQLVAALNFPAGKGWLIED